MPSVNHWLLVPSKLGGGSPDAPSFAGLNISSDRTGEVASLRRQSTPAETVPIEMDVSTSSTQYGWGISGPQITDPLAQLVMWDGRREGDVLLDIHYRNRQQQQQQSSAVVIVHTKLLAGDDGCDSDIVIWIQ